MIIKGREGQRGGRKWNLQEMGWKWRARKWVWRRGRQAGRRWRGWLNVDEIDSGEEKMSQMEEYWQGLSSPTIEKELIDKWHACIFLQNKSAGLYIGRMKKRFLNDEGGMVLALELDCVEHKLGFADNILQEAKRKDVDVYPVKDIICEPLQMNPLKGGYWEYP